MRSRGREERRRDGKDDIMRGGWEGRRRGVEEEEDSLVATGPDPARELRCHGNGLGKPLTSKFWQNIFVRCYLPPWGCIKNFPR